MGVPVTLAEDFGISALRDPLPHHQHLTYLGWDWAYS